MKLLLVHPPNVGKPYVRRRPYFLPLAQSLLGTIVREELDDLGVDVEVLDAEGERIENLEAILNRIEKSNPDIVGISSSIPTYPLAQKISQLCKELNREIVVVMGGIYPTFAADKICLDGAADIVGRFEGERLLPEIVRVICREAPLKSVDGITFVQKGQLIETPSRPWINIDENPVPDRDLLPMKIYEANNYFENIECARGCPYSCTFCSEAPFKGHLYRERSIDRIFEEIEIVLGKYKPSMIRFTDAVFTLKRKRVQKFHDEIKSRGLDFRFGISTRVDLLNEEMIKLLSDMGCVNIFLGIESASQKILDNVRKGQTVEQSENTIKLCLKHKIEPWLSFILGLPGETIETAEKTIKFKKKFKGVKSVFSIFVPELGSELYSCLDRFGMKIRETDLAKYTSQVPIVESPSMSLEQLANVYLKSAKLVVDDELDRISAKIDLGC